MAISGKNILISSIIFVLLSGCADELVPLETKDKEGAIPIAKLPLFGLDKTKPTTMTAGVQVAYNADTIFFHFTWQGDKGDTDEFLRYTAGKWQLEGGHRREAQSSIDNDSSRGRVDVISTNAETSVSFMLNDSEAFFAIPKFKQFGCFIACHDDNMYMPKWDGQSQNTMYLRDDVGGSIPVLDLWVHRMALGSPTGWADDQAITKQDTTSVGGRKGESGQSAFESNVGPNNVPESLLDGSQTNGNYTFKVADREQSQYRFFMKPTTIDSEGNVPPITSSIVYIDAQGFGYSPEEGDVIPATRLRQATGNRGDISTIDTHYDAANNTVHASMQRTLNTSDASNPLLAEGKTYDIAFAIHTGDTAGRDHYISFPMTLSLGSQGTAQIKAVNFTNISGTSIMPDFSNLTLFPIIDINMVLPGITSYEFLIGENFTENLFKRDGSKITNVSHFGKSQLTAGNLSCTVSGCHQNITAFSGLVARRGGVNEETPLKIN